MTQKLWPNTQLTYQTVIRNNGALVTPTTITFKWKLGRFGGWTTETPTAISTGVYQAYPTPTWGGVPLYWMWQATGPAVQEEGFDRIEGSQFDTTGMPYLYDYGFGYRGYS